MHSRPLDGMKKGPVPWIAQRGGPFAHLLIAISLIRQDFNSVGTPTDEVRPMDQFLTPLLFWLISTPATAFLMELGSAAYKDARRATQEVARQLSSQVARSTLQRELGSGLASEKTLEILNKALRDQPQTAAYLYDLLSEVIKARGSSILIEQKVSGNSSEIIGIDGTLETTGTITVKQRVHRSTKVIGIRSGDTKG